jgi:hypothetical protein
LIHQTTFADLNKVNVLDSLTDKQLRMVRLLRDGSTQGMIARRLNISRASVSQTCGYLEQNNLIKKLVGKNYNILYEVSVDLQKRIGGVQEQITACRVHNIAMKFHIISQDHPLSVDKRSGYSKDWPMRGGQRYAYWYPGKAGEIACTVTVHPRTIVIRMDAKQTILAKDVFDAESRAFQHLIYIRQKFIDSQRLFGINFEIEPTGQRLGKTHGGFAGSASNPVMQEGVTTPGWWIDKSGKGELGENKLELESYTERGGPTRLDNLIKASEQFEHLPEMFRDIVNPIGAEVTAVKAMIQGEVTMQRQYEAMMKFMTAAMTEIQTLRREVSELKAKG